MELFCIVDDCEEEAFGLVMVNDNNSGLTIFMIPACYDHGQVLKSTPFNIQLRLNENPKVTIGEGDPANTNLHLTFEAIEVGIG